MCNIRIATSYVEQLLKLGERDVTDTNDPTTQSTSAAGFVLMTDNIDKNILENLFFWSNIRAVKGVTTTAILPLPPKE